MKLIKIATILFLFFGVSQHADAQLKDWLNKKKQEAKEKVNSKIEQKSSEGIDKVVEAPEKVIKNKKEKKKSKTEITDASLEQNNQSGNEESSGGEPGNHKPIEVVNEAPSENGNTVIQTNIKCENGKKAVLKVLKKQDGVFKADINIKNGELTIEYSSDGTPYTQLISLINENGFEADGNPATSKKNGCK